MSAPIAPFRERYRKALGDSLLSRNLLNFQRAYRAARRAAFEHFATTERLGVGVRLVLGVKGVDGFVARWDQLDLSNPDPLTLTCPVGDLRRE